MFGTIRRHQKWLWAVIITLTILSFVVFFSPAQRLSRNSGRGGGATCYVGGRSVGAEEFDAALREVYLEFFCNYGSLPDAAMARQMGFEPEQRTYQRLAMIEKANEQGLSAGDEGAQRMAANVVNNFRRQGVNSFRDIETILSRQVVSGITGERYALTGADFARFARHELIIQQLLAMSGLAGNFVTPQEAEDVYRRENEQIEAQAVFFHSSNYLASVKVAPEALGDFFTNRMADYRIGERAVLDYIGFPGTNFLAEAELAMGKITNLTELINSEYQRRGTNAFPDAKTPEDAKAEIKQEVTREQSLLFARRAATAFATQVFADETNRLARLHSLAAGSNLVVRTTEPFVIEDGPKEFVVPATFSRVIERLSPEEPVPSSPVVTSNAVYVVALVRRIPSENPALDSVLARVTEDFKQSEALLAAQKAGAEAAAAMQVARTGGKSFEEACAATQITPVKLPVFSISSRSEPEIEKHISLSFLENVAFPMVAGETSGFRSMPDGGFILHLVRRLPVSPEKMQADWSRFMTQMRQNRRNEALSGWFRKLEESGYLDLLRPEMKGQPGATNAPPRRT